MGNILNLQSKNSVINHLNNFHIKLLNENEHKQLQKFKIETRLGQNNNTLFTTYPYQKIGGLSANFILCKSKTVDEIIKNNLIGKESILHLSWNYSLEKTQKTLSIKDFFVKPIISHYELDLIEIHSVITSKSCKTLLKHDNIKNQEDQTYFYENDIIDGIMVNFVIYPPKKILLLNYLMLNNNILDVEPNILNLYITMIYSF